MGKGEWVEFLEIKLLIKIKKIIYDIMIFNIDEITNFIHRWQTLVGAAVGVAIPIIFTVAMFRYQNKKNFKQDLGLLEKILVRSMNDLNELRDELLLFIGRLDHLIEGVNQIEENQYYAGLSNFPVHEIEFDSRLINTKTGSLYLANKLMFGHIILKSIHFQITGFREEFISLMNRNHDIIVSYKDPQKGIGIAPREQKLLLLSGLQSIRKVLNDDIVGKNIPTAIEVLLKSRTYLLKYIKHAYFTKLFYEGPFNYFIKKEDGINTLEKRISKDIEVEFKKMQKRLNKNSGKK